MSLGPSNCLMSPPSPTGATNNDTVTPGEGERGAQLQLKPQRPQPARPPVKRLNESVKKWVVSGVYLVCVAHVL